MKRKLHIDTRRRCRVQCRNCGLLGKETTRAVHRVLANQQQGQSRHSWFLQRKAAFFLSLCVCAPGTWRLHWCVCSQNDHAWSPGMLGHPLYSWKGASWSEPGDERVSLPATREAQVSLRMVKVYGLALPNSKWTTTSHWNKKQNKAKQSKKKGEEKASLL